MYAPLHKKHDRTDFRIAADRSNPPRINSILLAESYETELWATVFMVRLRRE